MKRKIHYVVFFISIIACPARGQHAIISGHVNLKTGWAKKIYISRISDFNLMYAASDKLIVARGDIDSSGSFNVEFPALENEMMFRLHVTHVNDPASTLIIGGEDENHIFFLARDGDRISFNGPDSGKLMDQKKLSGGESNNELNDLLSMMQDENLSRDSLRNGLINAAGRSKSELVGLLAIYSTFGLSSAQKKDIEKILNRYHADNPYGSKIFEEYKKQGGWPLVIVLFAIFIAIVGYLLYRAIRKRRVAKISESLSQRETAIVRLILDGKSNKEIASALNIELSTVKTHVNNIYTKLKIDNRKDLLQYKEIFTEKTRN